ncbi:helix-turn-helix domain-containing protein [Streptomyces natalensis]|uniref:HTH cro/C1-type domain-containing protein n=1 Tax=Streptomyces natalensis ATCC 27448 TaxID=1240678 RepID=A0A0D7CVR0_9ACTN|nr:helix-turn-helix transcriptional regulator [Streptomyces natalensis]KIZ19467.1 hypothetical protein SNA_02810 [Streptomyces natalensis ATCC 27448]
MPDVPGNPNQPANIRRKPLAPLPDELTGPVRDFVCALRRMHGELGYSLKDLQGQLPASRSSLSRYLRGQSLPDERLLVQWCKLSFTGEDRLPALIELLHRAYEAAEGTPSPAAGQGSEQAAETVVEPVAQSQTVAGPEGQGAAAPRRRWALVLAVVGTVAVLAAAAFTVPALTGSGTEGPQRTGGPQKAVGPQGTATGTGPATITVHNVERACQHSRIDYCALGLVRDPYRPYRRSNVVGHVWHGDVLHARCRIANGVTVTDEVGGHSSMWVQVDHDGKQAWLPGIRTRPEQLDNNDLPSCPDSSLPRP